MMTCDILGPCPFNSGLGNQLFCIATALSLSIDNNDKVVFPDLKDTRYKFYLNTIFHKLNPGIDKNFVENFYKEKPYSSTIYEKIPYKQNLCIRGHFQSYKYFNHNRKQIIDLLKLPDYMIEEVKSKYSDLINLKDTVSVHFRRGDYLTLQGVYEILDDEYYSNALSIIENYSQIVVFSDDISWCKTKSIFENKNTVFIENEFDVVDLYLMSKMKNNIIANSTFSWWGAFLNQNINKKVVAPVAWFGPQRTKDNFKETRDLVPPSWIRI